MAIEKRLYAIPSQLLTLDGQSNGLISLPDSTLFKVKQVIFLASSTQSPIELEVKRIDDGSSIWVGPKTGPIDIRFNASAFLVADGAFVFANEQARPGVPEQVIPRAVFEEEPTLAIRSIGVDKLGNPWSAANPMPVHVDGDINVGDINVRLSHLDNVPNPGDIADSIRVGDGTDVLQINADGSVNVIDNGLATLTTATNTLLDAINTQLTTGVLKVDDDQTQTLLNSLLSQLQAGGLIIGTEDGTPSGVQHVFVNNLKSMILASHDREQEIEYADFGTANQRVTKIDYTSPTFPGIEARKEFVYTLVGNRYRRDSILWRLI
jgi:hypothetical protein